MVKRKWSLDLNQWLQNAPTRRSSRHASPQPVTEAIILDVNSRQLIRDNVVGVLARAPRGIWMRLLPLSDDTESIYFANGMEWSDVLPGLLHTGLVTSSKVNNKLCCPRDQREGLIRHSDYQDQIPHTEIGSLRRSQSQVSLFISVGKPMFGGPVDQINSGHKLTPFPLIGDSDIVLCRFFRDFKSIVLEKEMEALINDSVDQQQ